MAIRRVTVLILMILMCTLGRAQSRVYVQTGPAIMTEQGYKGFLNTALGMSWRFENNFSWGLQYAFMKPGIYNNHRNFHKCDSFLGWDCVEGYDTSVFSKYAYTYRMQSVVLHLLYHTNFNGKWGMANGISSGLHFIKREMEVFHEFFPDNEIDNGIGATVTFVNRISWYPFKSKSNGEIYLEPCLGMFYSNQPVCDDANCDNFLAVPINFYSRLQVGIAIDLN